MAATNTSPASSLLHECLSSSNDPTKCLKDCIVGPSASERKAGSSCWGDSLPTADRPPRKRPRDQGDHVPSNHGSTESTFHKAVQTFLSSGCCVVPKALTPEFVQICLQKASKDYRLLNEELEQRRREARQHHDHHHTVANAYRVDYREMVDRDGGRRDVRYDLDQYPYTAPGLIYNSMVMPLIQTLLGGTHRQGAEAASAVNLLYMGVMWARRANDTDITAPQKWHADGGHVFDHCHLPPHCINVFFPLIDVTQEHGPTCVQPGSHILGSNENSSCSFGLEAKAGDAILFDYRLRHRGELNTSNQDRPVLYLAYSKPWFRDTGNTRAGLSIFGTNEMHNGKSSHPWVSRLLTGQPMPMMAGFDHVKVASQNNMSHSRHSNKAPNDQDGLADGSGERWILFKMNVQLDGNREETLVVHASDIPLELATQFCLQHHLSKDFVPVLTETIRQQMNQTRQVENES